MERLNIDEVIDHCKRHVERMESHYGKSQLEKIPIENSDIMKQYWEHRQVAEWLEQLKDYKDTGKQELTKEHGMEIARNIYNAVTDKLISLNTDLEINLAIQNVILDFIYK